MRSLLRNTVLLSLVCPALLWADTGTATTTLSIEPAPVAGTTINAADESSRNSDTTTFSNSHLHSLSNTTNFGDGAAGNKQLCADAADSTDSCIRWNDTADLWQLDHPIAATFNQIATITNTAGLTANQVVIGDGTSSLITTSGGSSGQVLTHQGGSLPTWTVVGATVAETVSRTAGNITTTSGTLATITDMSITFTTGANPVIFGFAATCSHTVDDESIAMNLNLDSGTLIFGTLGLQTQTAVAAERTWCGFTGMTADLTAASHTLEVQWSESSGAGTATVVCESASACLFWAVEVTD